MSRLTLEELKQVADGVTRHASVIIAQRDPHDNKMDEKSALLHKLWRRLCEKLNVQAGSYVNNKTDATYAPVLSNNVKKVLDTYLDQTITEEEFQKFLEDFFEKAYQQIAKS